MLTGDNPRTAAAIAAEAGIREFRAGILPGDKAAAVAELKVNHSGIETRNSIDVKMNARRFAVASLASSTATIPTSGKKIRKCSTQLE